jgi:hypothetical protein
MKPSLALVIAALLTGCSRTAPLERGGLQGVPVRVYESDGDLLATLSVVLPAVPNYPGEAAYGVWTAAVAGADPNPGFYSAWLLLRGGSEPTPVTAKPWHGGVVLYLTYESPSLGDEFFLRVPSGSDGRTGTWETFNDAGVGEQGRWEAERPLLGRLAFLTVEPPGE